MILMNGNMLNGRYLCIYKSILELPAQFPELLAVLSYLRYLLFARFVILLTRFIIPIIFPTIRNFKRSQHIVRVHFLNPDRNEAPQIESASIN